MPSVPLIVRIVETPPLIEVSKRGHTRAMTAGHKAMGEYWQEKILPGRFKYGAAGKAQRSLAWDRRKQRQTGKVIGLVGLSGLAESIALQQHVVRAYPTRASVKIPGPSYFTINPKPTNKKGKPTKRHNLVKEVLFVTDLQQEKLGDVMGEKYSSQLKIEAANFGKRERTFK